MKPELKLKVKITGIDTAKAKTEALIEKINEARTLAGELATELADLKIEVNQSEPKEDKPDPIKLYCVKDYEPGVWLTKGKVYTTDAKNMLTFDDGFRDVCDGHGIVGFAGFIKRNPNWKNLLVPLVKRPAKVGEWVLYEGEGCEVIAGSTSFGSKNVYVRTQKGDQKYNGSNADRPIKRPFTFLEPERYLVLDGYQPPEEPKFYSGKVVCVENHAVNESEFFTVGKVYEFKDGYVKSNTGNSYNAGSPVKAFADLFDGSWLSRFIEFKGE